MNHSLQLASEEQQMFADIFNEVSAIMSRYSHIKRTFGIHLVEERFPLRPSEVMYETCNKQNRVVALRPVVLTDLATRHKATAWQCIDGKIVATQFCDGRPTSEKKAEKRLQESY